jgi:hypothetical protein
MKKLIIVIATLSTLSGAAVAGDARNYDLRDSETYTGKFATNDKSTVSTNAISAIQLVNNSVKADREQHRLDEKH